MQGFLFWRASRISAACVALRKIYTFSQGPSYSSYALRKVFLHHGLGSWSHTLLVFSYILWVYWFFITRTFKAVAVFILAITYCKVVFFSLGHFFALWKPPVPSSSGTLRAKHWLAVVEVPPRGRSKGRILYRAAFCTYKQGHTIFHRPTKMSGHYLHVLQACVRLA